MQSLLFIFLKYLTPKDMKIIKRNVMSITFSQQILNSRLLIVGKK